MGVPSKFSIKTTHVSKRAKIGLVFFLLALLCTAMLYDPSSYNESFTIFELIAVIAVLFVVSIVLIIPEILYICLPVKMLWHRWEQTDNLADQKSRMLRALANELTLNHMSKVFRTASYLGQTGDMYATTLNGCTCEDFLKRKLPCKHMYYLAITLGAVVPPGDINNYAENIVRSNYRETVNNQSLDDSSIAIEFEQEYEPQINAIRNKIEKAEAKVYGGFIADKTVFYYQKAIELHQELKSFCFSHSGGKEYYEYDDCEAILNDLQNELTEYLENDYKSDKECEEKLEEQQKMEDKILDIIASSGGCLQKDISPQFLPYEKNVVSNRINVLISQNRIVKEKHGSLNFLRITEECK